MKELFYAGIQLEEDSEMIGYLQEVRNNPEALVLEVPEEHLVHEMKYVNHYNDDRRDTGRTHIGYDYHYFTFFYKGYIVGVNSGTFYPFINENSPGRYNFILYERVGLCYKSQMTYSIAYEGLHSVDQWLNGDRCGREILRKKDRERLSTQFICPGIYSTTLYIIEDAVKRYGGFREKKVLDESPFLLRAGTWNDEHGVVHVISAIADSDGHRDSFDCDVVTGCICG